MIKLKKTYLILNSKLNFNIFLIYFNYLLLSNFVPISLIVTLEMVKYLQGILL